MARRQRAARASIAAGLLLLGAGARPGHGSPAERNDLARRLARLEAQVAALQPVGDRWLTEERAAAVRRLTLDVLDDADRRASRLRTGLASGYDGGFFVETPDGNFRLRIQAQIQVRFIYNHRDDALEGPLDDDDGDDDRWGFDNRRTKLKFDGHVGDGRWLYAISGGFSRSTGRFRLRRAWIARQLDDAWQVRVGQFKAPFMREELASAKRLLLIERSLVNEAFSPDFTQGIELAYAGEHWNVRAMLNDGANARNEPWNAEDVEIGVTARAELLAFGDWRQFRSMSSPRGSDPALLLGTAVLYQQGEFGTTFEPGPPPSGNSNELEDLRVTADASLQLDGATAFASAVYQRLDGEVAGDADRWGVVVQGGLYVTDDVELYARYEAGDLDLAGVPDLSVVTVGFNRFWADGKVKLSGDVGYGFNEVGPTWAAPAAGWLADAPREDGQIVVRSQLQLVF